MPVKKRENTTCCEKYEGPRTNNDGGIHALTRDCSTLIREKYHGSSRPDSHETCISRVIRIVAGRVGSGQEAFKISRVGSGRVWSRRLEIVAGSVG